MEEETLPRWHRREQKEQDSNHHLRLRNWLNVIFMLTAIVGVACYSFADKQTGIIIILAAMMVKFTESAIRLIKF